MLLLVVSGALAFATLLRPAETSSKMLHLKVYLPPLGRGAKQVEFAGKEKASVECSGKEHKQFVGLYVYDRQGNCVAWDDLAAVRGADRCDVASVEWYPPASGAYVIEIHNFSGSEFDGGDLIIK